MRACDYDMIGDRLYARALAIEDDGAAGHALPIWRAMALRGNPYAQQRLADILSDPLNIGLYRPRQGLAWYRRAIRSGNSAAMYNMAITCRNSNKLGGYRYWLARSARIDTRDVVELKQFRTRFSHAIMRRWHRYNGMPDLCG